jgi:hypothetical protein
MINLNFKTTTVVIDKSVGKPELLSVIKHNLSNKFRAYRILKNETSKVVYFVKFYPRPTKS